MPRDFSFRSAYTRPCEGGLRAHCKPILSLALPYTRFVLYSRVNRIDVWASHLGFEGNLVFQPCYIYIYIVVCTTLTLCTKNYIIEKGIDVIFLHRCKQFCRTTYLIVFIFVIMWICVFVHLSIAGHRFRCATQCRHLLLSLA